MERSTKILTAIILILGAIAIVAVVAPGAVVNFTQGTIIAPVVAWFIGVVVWIDTFRASYLLATGIIGGLFVALLLKKIDLPKKIRMATGKPKPSIPSTPLQGQLSQDGVFSQQQEPNILVEDETK